MILPDRLLVLIHRETDLVRLLDYKPKKIWLHVESEIELMTRLFSVQKEPEMLPWLQTNLQKEDVFYDIGANIGAYSLLASALMDGDLKVYSFEPSASNYSQLVKNIELNKWARNVIALPVALTEKKQLIEFAYYSTVAGSALHAVEENIGNNTDLFVQRLLSMSLDALIAEYGLPKPTVMKIDIDGREAALLAGAQNTLANTGLKSIFIELEEATKDYEKSFAMLQEAGFTLTSTNRYFANPDSSGHIAVFANCIFSRQ